MMAAGSMLGALGFIAIVAGGLAMFGLAFIAFFGGFVLAGRGWSRWRLYSGWAKQV
jgi:hypothetical protein